MEAYKISKLKQDYGDYFAGAFIKNRILNINLVNGTKPCDLNIDTSKVRIHFVEYSYNQLLKVYEQAIEFAQKLTIQSIELNERENKVIIYVNKINKIRASTIQKKFNVPLVEIKIIDTEIKI